MIRFMVVVLALACAAIPAHAEELTAEKRANIERLLELTGALALGDQMAAAITNSMAASMKQNATEDRQRAVDIVAEETRLLVSENLGSLVAPITDLYHRHFSGDDIQGLIAFYESELGRRTLGEMPGLMQESMQLGQQWAGSLVPLLQSRVKSRLEALDQP
ncbi:MAG: DUF2059 domain-containing protein [Pseudomonadales bacterium]